MSETCLYTENMGEYCSNEQKYGNFCEEHKNYDTEYILKKLDYFSLCQEPVLYSDAKLVLKTIDKMIVKLNSKEEKKNYQSFLSKNLSLFKLIELNLVHFEGKHSFFSSLYQVVSNNSDYLEKEEDKKLYEYYKVLFYEKSQETTPKILKKIGSGSYGNVYERSCGDVIKVVENVLTNYSEIFFLKSFTKYDFIPKIKGVNFTEKKIEIILNNCGQNLYNFSKTISYVERVKLLPSILVQMGRFLSWMKQHNIAHMDIKPENICIDKEGKITFIDWGLVGPVCYNSEVYVGTHAFADPSHLERRKKICHEYDMFSCGMTILSFLTKSHVDPGKRFIKDLKFIISTVEDTVIAKIGPLYMDILRSMLDLNERTRLEPYQLYGHLLFDDIRCSYPLYDIVDNFNERVINTNSINNDIDNDDIDDVLEWIGKIIRRLKYYHLHCYTVELFLKLLNKYIIQKKKLQIYCLMCLQISNLLFHSRTQNVFDINDIVIFCSETYTQKECEEILFEICNVFNWELYPQQSLLDWNFNFNN